MATKRKHVVFEEAEAVPSYGGEVNGGGMGGGESGEAAGPSIHPDRLAAVAAAQPVKKAKVPKVKSERKKKYLAKKARKARKMKSAKKAATPKERVYGSEDEESEEDSDNEESDEEEEKEDEAKAGPSTAVDVPISSGPTDGLTEAQEIARRKAEKRAKRDARREERRAKRRAERLARKAKLAKQAAAEEVNGEVADTAGDSEEEEDVTMDDGEVVPEAKEGSDDESVASVPDLPERRSRSPSPPPLQPFPLPRMAPAPDAAVLSRQGMPTGLEDAEFIDQSLRMKITDLPTPLSERVQARLADVGVEDFFAVQAAILPHILPLPLVPLPYTQLSDYLISAPTGSGKTLAYSIPIVEVLAKRIVPRLRALIVLPTRDLVVQVRETLEALAKGTGLMIGSVTGQHSFAHEQTQLVGDSEEKLLGGFSKLDILIATPGRLMDHLASTPNFTLQHLRFLVIDEADRLLTQSFQNWLAQVLAHTRPPTSPASTSAKPYDAVAPSWQAPLGLASDDFEGSEPVPSTCQKLLFSATLTRDPAKVAALDLTSPRYFIVQSASDPSSAAAVGSSFALPAELQERSLILPPALKPLNLIHLIHSFNATPALVFTKSVEAATRLVRLLEFFEDAFIGGKRVVVKAYTRDMPPGERKRLLADFGDKVDVLVCSDLVARGMDLPSVEHVISYDVPLDMTKYVHRAGRTARAGRSGTAWTMVEKQEALHFKSMLKAANHSVKKVKVKEDELAPYKESYEIAMKRLKAAYGRD